MTTASQPNDDPPLLIPVRTVAHLLQVSPRTVWRLVSAGKLLPPVRLGNVVRWHVEELKAWLARGQASQESK